MLLALLSLVLPAPLPAARPELPAPGATLAQLLDSGRHPDLHWGNLRDVQPVLGPLYAARNYEPLWLVNGRLTLPARALIKVLAEAPNRGLDSADYDADWLAAQGEALPGDTAGALAPRVELGLSVAAVRIAVALRLGRVSPAMVHATWRVPEDSFDVASTVTALAGSTRPNDLLRNLEPPFLHYWLLMATLVRYRELARDSNLVALPPMPRRLRPGEGYAGTPTLRRLLRLLGDYRDSTATPILDTLYSGAVVEAVKRFQMRQGFAPDGVIGDSTRGRLQHPFEQRLRQMELSLERWRWMPRRFAHPPIIVNIPAFRLYAFGTTDLSEREMLAMNVVVGTAFKTETPVFADQLEYLTFAPYWDVTPTIAVGEIKPAATKDPSFLARNQYELVEKGEVVPPWPENIARIGQGIRVRQTPGPHNALGKVKFIMPNDFQVYLHDTPSKAMFERTRRDASHGCIRLGDPLALARFLLRDQPDWTPEKIEAAATGPEPTTVRLREKIPVIITYATAVARENGDVFFYSDIYGHDKVLAQTLARGYPYR